MRYEMEDKYADHRYLPHEEWDNLLSNLDTKENRKGESAQIRRLSNQSRR